MPDPDEVLISLNAAAAEFGTNRRVSFCTLHRWSAKGCRGHVLETRLVGGRRYTSKAAIRRFLDALNSGRRQPGSGGFSDPRAAADERADRELRRIGL